MNTDLGISYLFENKPGTWGLRGDPHLWREMKEHFSSTKMPLNLTEMEDLIRTSFHELTGQKITSKKEIYIRRYDHGGMSGGYISPRFWHEKVLPILRDRYQSINSES